eukprot:TRINITY_DN14114_c0_g1_i2.p1 TRINITY_DN14114_c0_g1~~TRINITY_DN14114_c0_g1_i2.p1  ORF type:complete len:227 (+),score=22.55 TRINITY_DN14114_c0_g1_i2:26-682(+)
MADSWMELLEEGAQSPADDPTPLRALALVPHLPPPLLLVVACFLPRRLRFHRSACSPKYSVLDNGRTLCWDLPGYELAYGDIFMAHGAWRWRVVVPHCWCWVAISREQKLQTPTKLSKQYFCGLRLAELGTKLAGERRQLLEKPLEAEAEYWPGTVPGFRVTVPCVEFSARFRGREVPTAGFMAFAGGTRLSVGGLATVRMLPPLLPEPDFTTTGQTY